MSLGTALARISDLEATLAPPRDPVTGPAAARGEFSRVLSQAGVGAAEPASSAGSTPAGLATLAVAKGELGQAEQPPGSNDSPRIAEYRAAVGGPVGPWCAYFVSWAARQAGVPLGDHGEGFASVDDLYGWAQRSGRAVPASAGPPSPGDLIVWNEHVGIVGSVLPDGRIETIEGNSSDQVSRRVYGPDGGGAIGYVRLG